MSTKAIPLPGSKPPKPAAISWLPQGGKDNETTAITSQNQRES
jgi:hypothetical protein